MSGSQPSKRRRIAGESKPEAVSIPEVSLEKPVRLPKLRGPVSAPEAPAAATPPPPSPTAESAGDGSVATVTKPPRTRLSAGRIVLVAAAVLSVAFGVVGAVVGYNQWQGQNVADLRRDASEAAASAAVTIFSYQYNQLPQHLTEAQATMTPAFAKKFKSISPALNALAPQRKIQVKAVVRDAATVECGEECDPNKATVLVFIDQARVADGVKKPTVFGNRIQVSMVQRNDKWLVNNVQAL